jgi:hypothetical protein
MENLEDKSLGSHRELQDGGVLLFSDGRFLRFTFFTASVYS